VRHLRFLANLRGHIAGMELRPSMWRIPPHELGIHHVSWREMRWHCNRTGARRLLLATAPEASMMPRKEIVPHPMLGMHEMWVVEARIDLGRTVLLVG
jgi:hypothetical protein